MKLLVDIGNSRIKFALADEQGIASVTALAHQNLTLPAQAQLGGLQLEGIWLASVLSAAQTHKLLGAFPDVPVHAARVQGVCAGLKVAYAQPERLGVDRWLAMLGLWCELQADFQVVSAGTALTFDAVDLRGQHLGGLIAAGLTTHQKAVLGATAFASGDAPDLDRPELGRDTEHCVAQGALHSALGLVDRASHAASGNAYISGGDAAVLLPHLQGHWSHRPNAVLQGLLAYASLAH